MGPQRAIVELANHESRLLSVLFNAVNDADTELVVERIVAGVSDQLRRGEFSHTVREVGNILSAA